MTKSFFDRLTGSVKADEEKEFGGSPYTPSAPNKEEEETDAEVTEEKAEEMPKPEIRAASVMTASRPRPRGIAPAPRERKVAIRDEDGASPVLATEEEEEGQLTVDIFDDGSNLVIQATVAGVKPEDLDLSITNDMITIRGKRSRHEEVNEENYYYKELYWGTFGRSVILPEEVDSEKAEATIKNGLLTVKLPKKRKDVKQKIRVKME